MQDGALIAVATIFFAYLHSSDGIIIPYNKYAVRQKGIIQCGHDHGIVMPGISGETVALSTCCRIMENCNSYISPRRTKYGLYNDQSYRILDCLCLSRFKECLHRISRRAYDYDIAQAVGETFFNAIKPKCMLKVYNAPCSTAFYHEMESPSETYDNEYYFCPKLIKATPYYSQ